MYECVIFASLSNSIFVYPLGSAARGFFSCAKVCRMNATFADAIWKRRFDESERQRRATELHIRLLEFCLQIRPPQNSDLAKVIEDFYESSRRFFDTVRTRGGAGSQLLHDMLQDAKAIAERNFQRFSPQPQPITFGDLQAYLAAAGVPARVPGGNIHNAVVSIDLALLTKAMLAGRKCQELSGVMNESVDIDLASFEGSTAIVAHFPMNARLIQPRLFESGAMDFRPDTSVDLNEITIGCFLLKTYVEAQDGWITPSESALDAVFTCTAASVPSAAPLMMPPPGPPVPARVPEQIPAPRAASMSTYQPPQERQPASPRPASVRSNIEGPVEPAKSLQGKVLNILLVDDNILNLRVMTKMLDGHNVATALNGPDALELFRRQFFSIVFLDIVLPNDVSGVDIAKKMNEIQVERKRAPVPIIAVTGHNVEDYEREAASAGIREFLSKPVNKSLLQSMLLKYCG